MPVGSEEPAFIDRERLKNGLSLNECEVLRRDRAAAVFHEFSIERKDSVTIFFGGGHVLYKYAGMPLPCNRR